MIKLTLTILVFLLSCSPIVPPEKQQVTCSYPDNELNTLDFDEICSGSYQCTDDTKYEHFCLCDTSLCLCFAKPGGLLLTPGNFCGMDREKRTVLLQELRQMIEESINEKEI